MMQDQLLLVAGLSVTKNKHAVLGFGPVQCLYKHQGVLGYWMPECVNITVFLGCWTVQCTNNKSFILGCWTVQCTIS